MTISISNVTLKLSAKKTIDGVESTVFTVPGNPSAVGEVTGTGTDKAAAEAQIVSKIQAQIATSQEDVDVKTAVVNMFGSGS